MGWSDRRCHLAGRAGKRETATEKVRKGEEVKGGTIQEGRAMKEGHS